MTKDIILEALVDSIKIKNKIIDTLIDKLEDENSRLRDYMHLEKEYYFKSNYLINLYDHRGDKHKDLEKKWNSSDSKEISKNEIERNKEFLQEEINKIMNGNFTN